MTRVAVAVGAVAIVAFSLRLVFIFSVSTIPLKWDALGYWAEAQQERNAICERFSYCTPVELPWYRPPFRGVLQRLAMERSGLLLPAMAFPLTILPDDPRTAFVGFALLDAIVCVILAHIVFRLKGPVWVAVLAGGLQAVYVPAIVGGAAFLQQPLIRFGLALAVWSYTCAFTSDTYWGTVGGIVGATIAMAVVGFSSVPSRPLMWLVPTSMIAFCMLNRRDRPKAVIQAASVIGLLAVLTFGSLGLASRWGMPAREVWSRVVTGLSSEGTVRGQISPISFARFWAPDNWPLEDFSSTTSLADDFRKAPFQFLSWWNFGILSNWQYPDYLYFQRFVLTLEQQTVQHVIWVVLGWLGIAWLLGQGGARRLTALVILTVMLAASVLGGMISVEPRRLSVLSPYLALGAAWFLCSLTVIWRGWVRTTSATFSLIFLATAILLWAIPASSLLSLMPSRPQAVYTALVGCRVAIACLAIVRLTGLWRLTSEDFDRAAPISVLASLVLLSAPVSLMQNEWRQWSAVLSGTAQQQITGLHLTDHLQPWLLVDAEAAHQGDELQISINGHILKPEGEPMFSWEAGIPPTWSPHSDVMNEIANFKPTRRTWIAFPIPRAHLTTGNATVELTAPRGLVTFNGDYLANDPRDYIGPLFDPWYTGRSVWRWMWNANDPRIPALQSLGETHYISRYDGDAAPRADDLSSAPGWQRGLYRVFVVEAAFGPATNALNPLPGTAPLPGAACANTRDLPAGPPLLLACRALDGSVEYSSGGTAVGRSSPAVFKRPLERNELADRLMSDHGRVDVIHAMSSLYVANLYSSDGRLLYSTVFSIK